MLNGLMEYQREQYCYTASCIHVISRIFSDLFVSYYVRMQCTLGSCERSGNLLVLIIPGWDRGSRSLISIISM